MSTVRLRSFNGGWWPMGQKDSAPAGTLRRAKGVSALQTQSILSRWGSTSLYALANAHSLFRYNGVRFQGVGTQFYRNGISVKTGLNGNRLSFLKMPSQAGDLDSLFVAGGGALFKVNSTGVVQNWGIAAPPDGFTAAISPLSTKTIDAMESAATWTGAGGAVLADEATIKQQGTNSMKMTVPASSIGTATKTIGINLTQYAGPVNSPLEDFITVWVRVDNPANLASIQLIFDVGAGNFASDTYTYTVDVSSQIPPASQTVQQVVAISTPTFQIPPGGFVIGDAVYDEAGAPIGSLAALQAAAGQTTVTVATGAWTLLRIPKSIFNRMGGSATTWANVAAVQLVVKASGNGQVIVYWDNLTLTGGAGLQGTYQYQICFKNSVTGSRSNANPTPVTIANVGRQAVVLSNLPTTSTDPQVDTIDIFRSVGNGVLLFLIGSIALGSGTYTDRVADFSGLDSTAGAKLMQNVQLPLDNAPPAATYNFAWGPYQATAWWCGDTTAGAKGRAYYSPVARPESVVGFLQVTNDDDPTQCGVVWNGANWVFTKAKLFQIVGTAAPFTSLEVFGVPGTSDPFTVVATPFGIVYRANDGVRLFNGAVSALIGPDKVGAIFLGEALEGVGPFEGATATFTRDEYVISDGTETLAVNLSTGAWRYYGVGFNGLFYEPDTKSLIAGFAAAVEILEDVSALPTTDAGTAIPFEVEIPAVLSDVAQLGTLQIVYVEANTNGQLLTPTLILDNTTLALPAFQTADRETVEWPVYRSARLMSVRLTGSLSARVEVMGIEADVYIPPVDIQRLAQTVKAFQQEAEAPTP